MKVKTKIRREGFFCNYISWILSFLINLKVKNIIRN